jgi:hypothetical protein
MKHPFLTLILAILCAATVYGQTIRTLGFNTTNGEIVYSGTNALTFTNEVLSFSYGPGLLISNGVIEGNGRSIAFEDGAVSGTFNFQNAVEFSAAAATRTNIGLGATWLTNTNVTNFRTAIGLGVNDTPSFESVDVGQYFRVTDGSNNFVLIAFDEAYFDVAVVVGSPYGIAFSGTNAAIAAATTRTNLGLGLPALTNTSNVTTMRALAGSTNTNAPFSGSISVTGTNNTNTLVFTNGILREVTTP